MQLVTQNVDDLHDQAGSRALVLMHRELLKARCFHCAAVMPWAENLSTDILYATCDRASGTRPHVVWFGVEPPWTDRIYAVLDMRSPHLNRDFGQYLPAAGFVAKLLRHARTTELSLEASKGDGLFEKTRCGSGTHLVPAVFEELLQG